MKAYGYIHLSAAEQDASPYLQRLLEVGASEDRIFIDTYSSTTSDCPSFQRLTSSLNPGDTLFVSSLNHLGINSEETAKHWQIITKDCGCDLVVLDMPLLDTRRDENIKELVVQLFDEFSKIRKGYSRQRQAEGIKKAKEQNVSFGRHPKPIPKEFKKVADLYEQKHISARVAAEKLNVSSDTFLKWYRNMKVPDCKSEKEQAKTKSRSNI